jgi:hypothetical protein
VCLKDERLDVMHVKRFRHDLVGRPQSKGLFDHFRRAERGHHDDHGSRRQSSDILEEHQIMRIRRVVIEEHHVERLADAGHRVAEAADGEAALRSLSADERFLEEKSFKRVGGAVDLHVDVRVIAATNRHLQEEVRQGRFREDLFYRLNVLPIVLPPLRERREDIPQLVHFYIDS